MSDKTLREVEASVEQLELRDQVRLLEYLAPRIARAVLSGPPGADVRADAHAAWQRLREMGERLAATSVPGAPSLTEAVSRMRR